MFDSIVHLSISSLFRLLSFTCLCPLIPHKYSAANLHQRPFLLLSSGNLTTILPLLLENTRGSDSHTIFLTIFCHHRAESFSLPSMTAKVLEASVAGGHYASDVKLSGTPSASDQCVKVLLDFENDSHPPPLPHIYMHVRVMSSLTISGWFQRDATSFKLR